MDLVVTLLIIVIGIIVDNKKKKQKEARRAEKKMPVNPPVVSPVPQKPVASVQQMMENSMTQKQQELKKRLQQKYGEAVQKQTASRKNPYSRPAERNPYLEPIEKNLVEESSIAGRVAENIKEEAVDELRLEQEREKQSYDTFPVLEAPEESELIKQINDLMIMGYDADLSSSRDFVAEGIEMLNQYELTL